MATEHPSEHSAGALPSGKTQKLLPASTEVKGTGRAWRKWALALFLIAVTALAAWKIAANKKEQEDATNKAAAAGNRAIPVTVAAVVEKTMPIFVTALGTVTAYNTVTVTSRVDGQLLSVPVREGQQVAKGQALAMIDPRPYEAVVAQAEGQLAKDEAAAANSRAEAARYTALYQAGVISKESEQVQVSNAGQSVGTLAADRAAIQAAKVNVAYTRITSPISGVVGLRQVDAGNIVHASDANGLMVVTQLQPITVIFTLPEDQLPSVLKMVRAGRKLAVEAFDRSQVTHLASGTLLTVDNQIDTTTGTVKVKAVFDNRDNALFPNQFVNVRLVLEQREHALVAPASAIQTGTNGTFVYVVKPGTPPHQDGAGAGGGKGGGKPGGGANAGRRGAGSPDSQAGPNAQTGPKEPPFYVTTANVVVDLTEGASVILKSGVKAGDQVVIDGSEKLTTNKPVSPKQGRSSAGGPSTQAIGSAGGAADAAPQADSPTGGKPEAGATRGRRKQGGNNGGGRP